MLSCGNWCEPASIERKVGLHFFFLFRIYQKGKVIKRRASHVEQCVPPCNELSNFGFFPSKKSEIRHDKMQRQYKHYGVHFNVGWSRIWRKSSAGNTNGRHLLPFVAYFRLYYRRKQEESKTFFLINLFTSGESWCNYTSSLMQ